MALNETAAIAIDGAQQDANSWAGGAPGVRPAAGGTSAHPLRGPVRLRTLTTLRWLAVAGQCAAIVIVHFALGFPLELGLCLAVIAASVWLNIFSYMRYSRQHFLADAEAAGFIAFDIAQLCALLGLTGGLQNPFAVLILSPVTIAASVLPIRFTAMIGALAIIGISIIGILHFPLPWTEGQTLDFPPIFIVGVWASLSLAVGFFAIYAHRVAAEAGQMKNALAQTQFVLAREEQLAAIGGLAAAAAHELGTPLATIQVTAKEMAEELKGQSFKGQELLEEDAKLLVSQAERCRDILGRLSNRNVDTDNMLERAPVSLLVKEAAGPFGEDTNENTGDGPAVIFELVGNADANAEPVFQRRSEVIYGIRNIIENAVSFARSKVLVKVDWSPSEVSISVHDDGPGFTPEILARLGEPYVSARARSRSAVGRKSGLGLGFFIAKTLLERTGGQVIFDNRQWEGHAATSGAWVLVRWPRGAVEAR